MGFVVMSLHGMMNSLLLLFLSYLLESWIGLGAKVKWL